MRHRIETKKTIDKGIADIYIGILVNNDQLVLYKNGVAKGKEVKRTSVSIVDENITEGKVIKETISNEYAYTLTANEKKTITDFVNNYLFNQNLEESNLTFVQVLNLGLAIVVDRRSFDSLKNIKPLTNKNLVFKIENIEIGAARDFQGEFIFESKGDTGTENQKNNSFEIAGKYTISDSVNVPIVDGEFTPISNVWSVRIQGTFSITKTEDVGTYDDIVITMIVK